MHVIISLFIIAYSGWTAATHLGVIFSLNLNSVIAITPCTIVIISLCAIKLRSHRVPLLPCPIRINGHRSAAGIYELNLLPCIVCLVPAALFLSWQLAWILIISLLIYCLFTRLCTPAQNPSILPAISAGWRRIIITTLIATYILLAIYINRSDLDDAFYASIASHAAANPNQAILCTDPMYANNARLPLLFPSYLFSSFELISGALGHLFSLPAMDFYYIYTVPIWAALSVIAALLWFRETIPRSWVICGAILLFITLLLGEEHRSPANFSFDRIFQGKAVFLTVMVPCIFYFSRRLASAQGTYLDLLLLGCCQLSSIGMSNFGMLAAPIAGAGAMLSNIPSSIRTNHRKIRWAILTLLIPLPYLIYVMLSSNGSLIRNAPSDTPAIVFQSTFGKHQQYLVAFLLVAGPILAQGARTRWQLAIPPLIFFGIFINPWLSTTIAQYVTSPIVYWRVTWSFPVLLYLAVSIHMIYNFLVNRGYSRIPRVIFGLTLITLLSLSLPYHTLRFGNIGTFAKYPAWKIPAHDLEVAQSAMAINDPHGSILAPEEISGVISRFENHPQLIITRASYLSILKNNVSELEYTAHCNLYSFVTGGTANHEQTKSDLDLLHVSTVILRDRNPSMDEARQVLLTLNFRHIRTSNEYEFWTRISP